MLLLQHRAQCYISAANAQLHCSHFVTGMSTVDGNSDYIDNITALVCQTYVEVSKADAVTVYVGVDIDADVNIT